mmetsp:Transcript_26735/g.51537  ORF Transcript_26735/g.51537 Transcript_26735/m.51537 type:complete len:486 (-) Transcript_26735:113-1570(-)
MRSEEGAEVLRASHEQAFEALAQVSDGDLAERAETFLQQLEASEPGSHLLSWCRDQIEAAQGNPDQLRTLLKLGANPTAGIKQQLLASGLDRDESGSIDIEKTVEKNKQAAESSEGADLLRQVQKEALDVLPQLKAKLGDDTSEACMRQLEKGDHGRELAGWARKGLSAARRDPEALRCWISSVNPAEAARIWGDDSSDRDDLRKMLKESCLKFISEQLPLLKIPQIHSVEDGFEYTIDNVNLSAFKISADGLQVELAASTADSSTRRDIDPILDGEPLAATDESAASGAPDGGELAKSNEHKRDAVRATAADLGVDVPHLTWSYRQTAFPYLHGSGTARACLNGGSVSLAFQLHRADIDGEIVPQLHLSSCSVFIASLTVKVHESTFSWVYNRLAYMFQDTIRQYIACSLQAALSDNIASLLTPLNTSLRPHWPVLLSAMGCIAEALPLAGDVAKPSAPKEKINAKNIAVSWPPGTPPHSFRAT